MNPLAEQQQALLQALFDHPGDAARQQLATHASGVGSNPLRGLQVYLANGHALAERALRAAYPVLAQLLGEESFAQLARAHWHAHPPTRGDVTEWGSQLADFVRHSPSLQDEPYLGDVARVEWAMHCCTTAADASADLSTLTLLTTQDPQTLTLHLAPGWAALSSTWPVVSILLAHLEGNPSMQEAGQHLRQRLAQSAVVWRSGLRVQLRQACAGEVALLQALQSGLALEAALERAGELDFSQWLPLAVQTGLVLRVKVCPPESASPPSRPRGDEPSGPAEPVPRVP